MSSLTRYFEDLRSLSPKIEPVVAILEMVQAFTGIGGDRAATALRTLDSAIKALEAHEDGALTHEELMAQLAEIHAGLAAARAGEDAALEERFAGELPP